MELAAYFLNKAASVTVNGPSGIPFERVFGAGIGEMLKRVN